MYFFQFLTIRKYCQIFFMIPTRGPRWLSRVEGEKAELTSVDPPTLTPTRSTLEGTGELSPAQPKLDLYLINISINQLVNKYGIE